MFRIEGFIEDKNLAKVMHSLNGLIMNLKVLPVVNAESKNGKVVAKTDGSLHELFDHWLTKSKLESVKPANIRQFCIDHGRSPKSYSNILSQMKMQGILRKVAGTKGNASTYKVVRK